MSEGFVEIRAKVPKTFKEFIGYVAESLGISEEKAVRMFIGDSLSTLSSSLPDEYRDDWDALMGFVDGENVFSPETVGRVLPGLAVMFIVDKHDKSMTEKVRKELADIITLRLSGRRAEIAKWIEEKTGKPIEEIVEKNLLEEYQILKKAE